MTDTILVDNKAKVERILVLDSNVALANDSITNNPVINASTGVYAIADGQCAILSKDEGTFGLMANTTGLANGDFKKISIVQGTGNTNILNQTGHGYQEKPFLESMTINSNKPVWFGSSYVVNEMYGSTLLSGFSGLLSETVHSFNLNQSGVRLQHQNGIEMKDGMNFNYKTPDYATLGTSAANAKNDIYTNLAFKANQVSTAVRTVPVLTGNQPFVVFGIGTGGSQVTASGTITCPTLTSIANGTTTSFTFMVITRNGVSVPQVFTVNTALREAIAKGISSSVLTGSDTLRVIEKATALAGTGAITKLLFVALDSAKALISDNVVPTKTSITITAKPLVDQTPTITVVSAAYEGRNSGRQWLIRWKNDAKNNVYTQQNYGWQYSFIQMPDYVKEPTFYNAFIILHGQDNASFTPHDEHYYATILLIPNLIPLTIGTPGTAVAFAQVSHEGKIVGTYIKTAGSGASGAITISPTYLGSGAVIAPTYSSGALTALSITNGGSGYVNQAPIGSASTNSLPLVSAALTSALSFITPENTASITIQ